MQRYGSRRIRGTVLIVCVSVALTAAVVTFVIPWLVERTQNLAATSRLIPTLALRRRCSWGNVASRVYRLRSSSKARVALKVYREGALCSRYGDRVHIGTRRITPQSVYLFLDEGVRRNGFYEFPFLLKHEEGSVDCVLAKLCKQGKLTYPRDILERDFKETYADFVPLRHLSAVSILFIDPGEEFTEDAIIVLPTPGAYRVMLIFTAVDCECVCASREFLIEGV